MWLFETLVTNYQYIKTLRDCWPYLMHDLLDKIVKLINIIFSSKRIIFAVAKHKKSIHYVTRLTAFLL